MTARRLTFAAFLLLVVAMIAPAAASAKPRMNAAFSPNRLGASTTIKLGFDVGSTASPLVGVELHLPSGVTSGFNQLGVDTCDAEQLQASGPSACPRNSVVGRGRGAVSVPVGLDQILEPLAISIFMAPAVEEQTSMLFYVDGTDPVISQLVFHSSMLGDEPPFGAEITTEVPEVPGLPGSPPAALVSMQTELGPRGLRYTKQVNGKTVSFSPEGFDVPPSCPSAGFPFASTFTFANGVRESATTRVPCPKRRRSTKR